MSTYKMGKEQILPKDNIENNEELWDITDENVVSWKFSERIKEEPYKAHIINIYDLDGNYEDTFSSITEAARNLNVSSTTLRNCVKGYRLYVEELHKIALYAGEDIKERLERIEERESVKRTRISPGYPVREYLLNGKYCKSWASILAAAEAFGVSYHDMTKCVKGKLNSIKDRIFLTGTEKIEDRIATIAKDEQKKLEKEGFNKMVKESLQIKVYTSSGEYLRTCDNVKEAAAIYGIRSSNIWNSITGKALVVDHMIFLCAEEDIEERMERVKNRKTHKKNI